MKTVILITGGSGFIGSHIVSRLSRLRNPTTIVYDAMAEDNVSGEVESIKGDVFDLDKLVKVARDREIDTVIHMVGYVSVPQCKVQPDVSFKLNVSSVQSILEAMRLSDAKRLIFPSTAVVYGAVEGPEVPEDTEPKPTTVYGCHKLAAESLIHAYAKNYGFQTTILRLFNVYGDLDKEQGVISLFIKAALANKPILLNGGDQRRDFVHLNDVIKAFTTAVGNGMTHHQTINIGSGFGLSIKEIAFMVQQRFPHVEVKHEPPTTKDHSYFADVSRMKTMLNITPLDPRIGIPKFIENCASKRVEG